MCSAGAILFYDYLLTLGDEVCRDSHFTILLFFADTVLFEIKYVWSGKKSFGASIPEMDVPSTDRRTAFWLFFTVHIICSSWIVIFPDS